MLIATTVHEVSPEREDEEGAVARRDLLGDADALEDAVHENGEPVAENLRGRGDGKKG